MNTSDSSNKTLFLLFQQVLNFWQGNSDKEDVEIMFQIAKVLEDSCRELETNKAAESFDAKLTEFWESQGLKGVPLKFFEKSSYHILSRYMVDGKFSDSVVNEAIKQFIVNRSERDFHEFAQQLVTTNQIVEALRNTLNSREEIDKYKAEHCLEELRDILISSKGDVEEVYSGISTSVSKDLRVFKSFLGILCLYSNSEIITQTQEVVALSLSNLLRESDNLKLYDYIFNLSVPDFEHIITKWGCFVEAFLKAVRDSFEKLRCDYSGNAYVWTNKGKDPCLSFDQVVTFFVRCKDLPGINHQIKEFLHQLGEGGFGVLVDDVMQKCQIK